MKTNSHFFVVHETRPHTDAPHIIRHRYLRDGDLVDDFIAAYRFAEKGSACAAAYRHALDISNPRLRYPAPPETVVKVIECTFDEREAIKVSDAIKDGHPMLRDYKDESVREDK